MEKVKVTKEVAEAIEDVRKAQYTNSEIIADIVKDIGCTAYGTLITTLIKFSRQSEGNIDILMHALVNGYEVEKTPEEKVVVYYEELRREFEHDAMAAVHSTLNLLGITIKGVTHK